MTIVDILSRKNRTWQSVDLRDLHPYAEWDEEELPVIEIDTHPAEPSDDPFFWIDDGYGVPEIVITNAQLYQRRMDELAQSHWW